MKIISNGVVHFWDIFDRVYVILESEFKERLMKEFMDITKTKYRANKLTGIARITISDYNDKKNCRMRSDLLIKICSN